MISEQHSIEKFTHVLNRFAQRVSMIKNRALINEELDPSLMVKRLKTELLALRDEVAFLKVCISDLCASVDLPLMDTTDRVRRGAETPYLYKRLTSSKSSAEYTVMRATPLPLSI